ncbi:MAG: hypothetical protein FWH29_02430 [Methanobrevibacter sp.]|nr:hypothetical protein [Methanobrevibacter sp.]
MEKNLFTKIIMITVIIFGLLYSFQCLSGANLNITNSTVGGISNGVSTISDGDVLNLENGIYTGSDNWNITIDKNLTIQGNSKTDTIIHVNEENHVFNIIEGNTLTLINLTIISNYEYFDEDIANYNGLIAVFNGSARGDGNLEFDNCNFINNKQTYDNVLVDAHSSYTTRNVLLTSYIKDLDGNELNGDVVFYINNKFSGKVYGLNGIATYNLDLADGNYTVHASYIGNGDMNYKISQNQLFFNVNSSVQASKPPFPTNASIYWVNPVNGNDSLDGLSIGTAKRSIQNAYNNALVNSYIVLLPGTYTGSGQNGISVGKNITFIGNDTAGDVIISPGATRFLTINAATASTWRTVNIYNMIITGASTGGTIYINGYNNVNIDSVIFKGKTTGYGSIDIMTNSRVNVNNCAFINSYGNYGSAIHANAANIILNVTNSNFTNNSAANEGGSIYVSTTAANLGNSSLYLNNVTFKDQSAGNYGGAIENYRWYIEASNTEFINCSATYGGVIDNNFHIFVAINSSFINCTATTAGGAIFNDNSEPSYVRLYNSTFINCKKTDTIRSGGALGSFDGTSYYVVNGCTFINCSSQTWGGAIGVGGGEVNITNSKFIDNYASTYGGAVASSGGTIRIIGSTFYNNSAGSYGGAVASSATGSVITVNNSYFYSNNVRNTNGYGGALGSTGGTLSIYNCELMHNEAASYGGAAGLSANTATIRVENSNVFNNSASIGGAFGSRGGTINLLNSTLRENRASTFGGAVGIDGSGTVVVNDSIIDSNSAGTYGGAIGLNGGNLNTTGSNYTFNIAGTYGGAIGSSSRFYVNYCNFFNNSASTNGGAIGSTGTGTITTTIFGSSFVNNYAVGNGTALHVAGRANINYNRFFANNDTPQRLYATVWTNTSQSLNVNVDYNWWGNNTHYATGVQPNYWIILNVNYTNIPLYNRTAHLYYSLTSQNGTSINESRLPTFWGSFEGDVNEYNYNISFDASKSQYISIPFNSYAFLNGVFTVDWWKSEFNNVSSTSTPNITSNNVFGKYKNLTVLNATLTDSHGYGLENLTVDFYIGGVKVASGITDVNGFVSSFYNVTSAGNFSFLIHYTGNDINFLSTNVTYNASFDKRDTFISSFDFIANAFDISYLNATIVDEYGDYVENAIISFYDPNGLLYGSSISNSLGFTSTSYIFNIIGNHSFYAYFGGNGNYTEYNSSIIGLNIATITFEYNIQNDTYNLYVNSSGGNDTFLGINWDNPLKSISRALAIGEEQNWTNFIIHIAPGIYSSSLNLNLNIVNNVTFIGYSSLGGEIIFDGEHQIRSGFNISPNVNVNIFNISFVNGQASEGGALYSLGTLNIHGSKFINNTASTSGGVIYNTGNFFIDNSDFINNKAVFGGAIYNNGLNFTVTNSNFTNNSQAIALATTSFNLNNNNIVANDIALQLVFNNLNYTLNGLSTSNNIRDNIFALGISGNHSNYTINDNFGLLNNGGIIFLSGSNSNTIVNSNITDYTKSDSWAIFFDGFSTNNAIISCNITNNHRAIGINGTANNIISSNIINNQLGIHILSGSLNTIINYNRILNNTFSNGFDLLNNGLNTNGNLNWWGTNIPLVNGINLDNWFVMELSANLKKTIYNATIAEYIGDIEISYHFLLFDNSTMITSFFNPDLLPQFFVNLIWNSTNGTIYYMSNIDGKRRYSQNLSLKPDDTFSFQAIGDNSDILLFLVADLTNTVNLTINKSTNLTNNPNFGDYFSYTITVTNNGLANATGVFITDILDYRLIFESADGNYNYTTGLWNIGNLNAGESITLTIIVRINGTGNITNLANLTGVEENNIADNTFDEVNFTVPATVNLTLTKNSNATENLSLGDLITFTIVLTNHGPDNATNIIVTDVLDHRLIYLNSNGIYSLGTVVWNIGSLAIGENITFFVNVKINGTGFISNTASVTDVEEKNISGNTSDSINFTVPETVNLTISKVNNVTGSVNVGDHVLYTIVVTNFGPDLATGVVVVDVLDPRLVYVDGGPFGVYDSVTRAVSWNLSSIGVGDSVILSLIVWVNGSGNISNLASVSVNEVNVGNNSTEGSGNNSTLELQDSVNLTITKTNNVSGFVNVGDYVLYTIVVTNFGPDVATGVVVVDVLDSRLVYVDGGLLSVYDFVTRVVSWNLSSIGVGDCVILSLIVWVNGSGNISNLASVSVNEVNIGNNSTEGSGNNSTLELSETVNLTIFKTNNVSGSVNVGDYVVYTIVVTNHGPDVATGVVVLDVLDYRLIYHNCSAGGLYNPVTRTVSWNVSSIGVVDNVTLTVIVRVNGSGNIVNLANVSVNELNIGENSTSSSGNGSSLSLPDTVNLTISKVNNATGSVMVGDYVLYTIVVTNHGPDIATGLVIVDVLDPRLVYIDSSVGGLYDSATRTVSWSVGSVGIGDTVTLNVTVRVNGSGDIVNLANVSVNELNIGENSTSSSGNGSSLFLPDTVNLTISKSVSVDGSLTVGSHIVYTIVVANHGPDIATGLVVVDVLDPRLVYLDSTVGGLYDSVTRTVSWSVGSVGIGDNVTLNITVWVNGSGDIFNLANLSVNEINIGENTTNANDSSLYLSNTVNLTISKTNNVVNNITVGDHIVYSIVITNHGPDIATGIVVSDVLDYRLIYMASTSGGFYNVGTRTVSWNIGTIGVGESRYLTITVIVNGTGNIFNIANVSVNEVNIGENSTSTSENALYILDTVNLTINKTHNVTGSVYFGDNIRYTIVVTNYGPDVATGVVVADVLDYRLIYVDSSVGGLYNSFDRTVSWNVGSIGIGESVTLSVTVKINGSGDIVNLANVSVNEINIGENTTEENRTILNVLKLETNSSIIVPLSSKIGEFSVLMGTVIDEKGNSVANVNISILVDGQTFSVTTNSLGFWSLPYTPTNSGNLSIVVTWIGNDIYLGFVNSSTLTVLKVDTSIVLVETPLRLNFTNNLIGHLHDEKGNPIAGATVEFYVNGTYIGFNLTDSNGKVVHAYTPNNTGLFNISLLYNGSSTYESSNNSIIIDVTIMATKIIIETASTKPFINTTIPITLLDEFGNPISNEKIAVTINGQEYNLTTNRDGKAFFHYTPSIAGDLLIIAYFNSTDIYLNSSSSGVLIVDKIPTSILLKNIIINTLQNLTFSSTLVDEYGNLLSDMIVEIFIDGASIGLFKTDTYGKIAIDYNLLSQGVYTIIAVYSGDNTYANTSSNSTLTVRPVKTSLKVSIIHSQNNSTSFIASLHDEFNKPLADKTVVFLLNGQFIGIAITDSNGIATFHNIFILEGQIRVEFLGDNIYRESIENRLFTRNNDSDSINPADIFNPPELVDPVDPLDPIDSVDPTDPTDSIGPTIPQKDLDKDKYQQTIPMSNLGNPMILFVLALLSLLFMGLKRKE